MTEDDLGARVERLEAARGRFDAAEIAFVRRLLDAAAEDDAARSRLQARAASALEAYERRVEVDRQRSADALAALPRAASFPSLRDAHAEGDYGSVLRHARRLGRVARRSASRDAREAPRPRLVARLREAGHGPGDWPAREPGACSSRHGGVGVLDGAAREAAERRYRTRAAERLTRGVLEAARARLPSQAGPYHGPSVALRALEDLRERHRPLLRAWMVRLDGLDAATPPPAPTPVRRRRR